MKQKEIFGICMYLKLRVGLMVFSATIS